MAVAGTSRYARRRQRLATIVAQPHAQTDRQTGRQAGRQAGRQHSGREGDGRKPAAYGTSRSSSPSSSSRSRAAAAAAAPGVSSTTRSWEEAAPLRCDLARESAAARGTRTHARTHAHTHIHTRGRKSVRYALPRTPSAAGPFGSSEELRGSMTRSTQIKQGYSRARRGGNEGKQHPLVQRGAKHVLLWARVGRHRPWWFLHSPVV
jgi:hypothetical protein